MKNRLIRLAATAAILLGAAGAVPALTATSALAAGCSGYSCHGRDPVAEGCSASSTVTAYASAGGVTYATLWNRYSGGCNANWSRAQLTSAAINAGYKMYVLASTSDSHGNFEDMCWPGPDNNIGELVENCTNYPYSGYGGSSTAYSDMVDGTNTTFAYVFVYNSSGQEIASAIAAQ
jgi:hypothetical protein